MKLLLLLVLMYQEPIKKDTTPIKKKQVVQPKKQGKRKIPYFY